LLSAGYSAFSSHLYAQNQSRQNRNDSIPETRYPISKTVPEEYNDLTKQSPADLQDPENVKRIVEYDIHSGMYVIRTKVGDMEIETPLVLTPEEYQDYSLQESMRAYYREKNEENFRNQMDGKFNLMDMQFNLPGADKLFGPGGVRVKSQGTAELQMGLKSTSTKNPSLPERSRNRTFFNFDTDVQLNMTANVGTKVNFALNYNTESTFDFDAQRLRLGYHGEEDEILKTLEGGNVSLNTSNSLIRGGAALFGIKTELQFGKLRINALLAQQESESQTISTKAGAQTKDFEIRIDEYDENRHFFLAHYFRDVYDTAMLKLPHIASAVKINRIEVWITNKRSNYDQSRNIVAFSDLGENQHIFNPMFEPSGQLKVPYNGANTLYQTITENYPDARIISNVSQTLNGILDGGADYEKIESARRLDYSEYTFNQQLGYISLNAQLQPDEVLAVAFEYTYGGKVFQVGEFSTDNTENTSKCLYVKLLKGTSMSPTMPFWDLMMKNIYSLNAYAVQKDRFRLDIMYQSDTIGTYVNSIPEGKIANQILLRVMNLDRLDANDEPYPNGFFDFVEGYTVLSGTGRIIFPVVEPFGSHLRKAIGNDAIADKYVFQELYDTTLTIAKQIAEKNKFILRGEYKASSSSEIMLGATNVARGSVVVTSGGATLTENVDYTVDYISGIVTILNESIIASNTPIRVSLENQSTYSMQRKTMVGLDVNYEFSKNFLMGATIMHLSEMPMTTKTTLGDESIKNTLWGTNISYRGESQWLTNMVDKLPLVNLTQPSQINFNAEFAHLIAGHYESKYTGGHSYLDDFESTQSNFDLLNPYPWALASTPSDNTAQALFPEATLVNNIDYGKNRALFAWYYIDGIFTRKNSSLRPSHITEDDLSNHYVRAVNYDELFPKKELTYNENNSLYVLNLAYYPNERGPYNLDADNINPDGTLTNPEKRWGGMMRRIEQSDFEVANIEYIEFWMMDPFIYNRETATGGDLYFNLGEISEDILKDEKKFFENGLSVTDLSQVDTTVWGKVPRQQSTVYAFDNTTGSRALQDVGLNGLSSEEEKEFPAYKTYIETLRQRLSPDVLAAMENDQYSPLNDPAGDKYHYFRGSDFDREEADILTRYKRYNGTEGNSTIQEDSQERYEVAAKMVPDVEDLNQDNTLNENEKYYEYKVSIRPKDMEIGQNYIVNKRTKEVKLENGSREDVTWYQFKIPVREYQRKIGAIQDFKTIRFMRVYMTDFRETTIVRLGTFALVRGEWRTYSQDLSHANAVASDGKLDVMSINIEEDGDREPVNYVLPPGVTRMIDPSQSQIVQQNEQALSLKVTNLGSQDARAIYKTTYYDLRRYKRMQLFVHAEKLIAENATELNDGELSVFMRLGSDYKNNYYEYEVPLNLTAPGKYRDVTADRLAVWPEENMINFDMDVLTNLKLKRNRAKSAGESGVSYTSVYSDYDPDNTRNKVSIVGNPSLAEVKTIMIGIRNNTKDVRSGEIWVNELRLTDFDEEGGWAANGNLNITLSDLGTFNASGRIETAGFGGLDQSISERSMDDYTQYAISAQVQLGKLFPEKARVSLPLYYAISKEITSPKYNPLDQDIKLQDALDAVSTQTEKDSIKSFSQDVISTKSLAINGVSVGIRSKTPMPYDPANISMSYAFSENSRSNPETAYETTKNYQGNLNYSYTPYVKPFAPFANLEKSTSYTRYIKQLSFNYLPSSISFQSSMLRNYYEMQLRDLSNPSAPLSNDLLSLNHQFYMDRAFSLQWNLLNNLHLDFQSGTNSRIEEPRVQVNKKLNPDQYQVWKDSVVQSIYNLGTPLAYDQQFNLTYTLPTQYIPVLDWITANVSFVAQYNWDKGAFIDESIEYGNTIKNQRQLNMQGNVNMLSLYNKSSYLKRINQKYTSGSSQNANARRNTQQQRKNVKYETTIELSPDSGVIVTHNLLNKKVRITARRDSDSTVYRGLKFKSLDFARVRILNRDSVKLKITVYPGPPASEDLATKALEYTTRFLMMLRRVSVQFSQTDGMMLPGFQPTIGDWNGQANTPFGNAPGWDFAFGAASESYVQRAIDNNWLVMNGDNIMPAMINNSTTINATATLEPAAGLKIDLNATRNDSRDTEMQYMFSGMPTTYGGTFTMTTIAFGGMFASGGSAKNGYASAAYSRFLDNRRIIASRYEQQYAGYTYPNAGFLEGHSVAGQPYNPAVGSVRQNSSDVLIPAFLAAYTGKDAKTTGLTAFPSILSLLPNWRINYDGLIKIPAISKHFKSMTVNHQYRCTYNVGGYTSFLNWVNAGDGFGFVSSLDGFPYPSTAFDISSVSLMESFSPLIGIDATLLNNVTMGAKISRTRNLNLNISSYQLVEALSNDVTISLGYKYADFNKVLKMKKKDDFNNDLTVRLDYTERKNQSLIRKIEDGYTQLTQGAIVRNMQFSADYAFSKSVTLRAFYDLQVNKPLVSSASYPTSNSNYGISLRLSLAQ
jgi:cell surface protein SprA